MIATTVMFDRKQIQLNLPDYPSLQIIHKYLRDYLPRTFDFRRHIIQLFDPTIGEFFDLNDDGLKSWLCLPIKEKTHMRLQIIRAGLDSDDADETPANGHSTSSMPNVFQKIERDIETLFGAIENLQTTASGIRDDFKSAVTKYQQYQQEKSVTVKPMPISTPQSYSNRSETVRGKPEVKPESEKFERPIRFPAEDIRYKNAAPPSTIVSLPVVSQAPLVSNVYQDEDDDENSDQQSASPVVQSLPPVDIDIPLLNVGEDFQALVSIVVNPSYFFVQNTAYTQDLEKLAQSMNDYYSTTDPPVGIFRPVEMSCCAARYAVDNRWYRARIKRYSAENTVELVYLDYGNNEERAVTELRPLDPAFARLPAQAICTALELIPVSGDNRSSWTKKASYKFHEDTLTKPLDVRILAQPTLQWPMYFVQLTIDEHTDVAETLISLRHARRAELADIVQIVSPRLDLDDYAAYNVPKEILQQLSNHGAPQRQPISVPSNLPKMKASSNSSERASRSITLPAINVNFPDHIGSCTVTSIISPSHFFIQLTEKNQFDELYTKVHETYLERISCDRIQRLKTASHHVFGVARNQRDQRFYRVQIVSHDREHRTLLVLCFDIGEYITIPDGSIYELLPEYQIYPAQAIQCSLALVQSVNDDWAREAVNLMNRFIGGKGFKTFRFYSLDLASGSIKLTDPALNMILYDMNTSDNSINEQLIERKLATPDANYAECICIANDAMADPNGYKHQRIRQYIESQRTYTQPVEKVVPAPSSSSLFIERNPVDVRYEQPQKQQPSQPIKPVTTIEPLPLPDDEDSLPYCPPVIDPEPRHWYAVEVTYVKSPGEFYVRFPLGIDNSLGQGREPAPYPDEMEPNQMLNDLHRNMADLYATEQRRGISTAVQYNRGQMVAVRYQSHWYRARVLEFKPATNFAWVQFVDQGDTRELGTNTMRPIHHKFLDLPLQAYLCRLDGFDEGYTWSSQDKDLFKKKIRDKVLYAKKIREPNGVQLVDLVEGEIVSFDSFWRTLHQTNKPCATPSRPVTSSSVRQPHPSSAGLAVPPNPEPPVRHLQPIIPGVANYASGSEYSQPSSMMPRSSATKKPSGAMIPPPPPAPAAATRQPMQFISAGFKQPVEYAHVSPADQLAQLQQQEGHRIQPTTGYSISKHFRAQR